jgi:FKBP-type peptidyl-prolyl cis-trans isomerase SlyD
LEIKSVLYGKYIKNSEMIIEDKKVVSIVYELRKDKKDGEIVEELVKEKPLTFLFGTGNLLPKFEENLAGLKTGEAFEFNLPSDDAYGPVQDNAIVDVPINVFQVDGKSDENILSIGNVIPMLDNEGRRLNGTVREVGTDAVKMDFNHPMAGVDLFFKGEVTEVREANEHELSHGHVHSSGSCEGCEDENCHSKHEH